MTNLSTTAKKKKVCALQLERAESWKLFLHQLEDL